MNLPGATKNGLAMMTKAAPLKEGYAMCVNTSRCMPNRSCLFVPSANGYLNVMRSLLASLLLREVPPTKRKSQQTKQKQTGGKETSKPTRAAFQHDEVGCSTNDLKPTTDQGHKHCYFFVAQTRTESKSQKFPTTVFFFFLKRGFVDL